LIYLEGIERKIEEDIETFNTQRKHTVKTEKKGIKITK
jgi:hypothetical protein